MPPTRRVGDVQLGGRRPAAGAFDHGRRYLCQVEVDVGDHHVRTEFGEADGGGTSDTAPGAGDHHELRFEIVDLHRASFDVAATSWVLAVPVPYR